MSVIALIGDNELLAYLIKTIIELKLTLTPQLNLLEEILKLESVNYI